ncbi:glycosyltransferase family 2 protein [Fulvivirgaceae bacterium PWU4]|uniref:Glycosyltransferase family 2 protein n=1 Tax=Chryseosolibacter histidini TaxID=2782349 RepID=A0AAP2DFU6_9BACT|nr:glycosyltransferase family 2 protein [Chryseosolibacter histidini]MBT1695430.1 glycosyltransferase family 2 protein [Chryseosolibacter histidini]
MDSLEKQPAAIHWYGDAPDGKKPAALLIPQYNESSNGTDFRSRLAYFSAIAKQFHQTLDVVVIDDGSTDDSLAQIKSFKDRNPDSFFVSMITPNANKVGALYKTILALSHEFVILSDFDTEIHGLDLFFSNLSVLRNDSLMGCYFRMLPFEGNGSVFLFQQLEYSMSRTCYKFHRSEQSVPVMPGAGCCYKRKTLEDIYKRHSGLRSGEDREATLLGLKLGYKTFYFENILTLTKPPSTFRSLIKQRVRWNLGYIETFHKERRYYFHQIRKFSTIGIRTIADFLRVNFVLLFPFIMLIGVFANVQLLLIYLGLVYCSSLFLSVNALLIAPRESYEFRNRRMYSILYYPLFKISLDCIAWSLALISFARRRDHKS